ncbi:MAG TPA: HAD-IA family hydrolase [Syntrophales bacterium]|nr:HAD-IA family hydrolase [Syntrophales bacterium]HOL59736.1 HAD-IA family hydrolase [Syntrophales bacterium]HPO35882.1 HAD-IA family hydrolase [Syntrophales bacterium]
MKREVDLFFFDLDGTIAETGRDLARSVNFMRRQMGLSELTEDEIKGFVGDGVRELIYRSLGERRELFDEAMKVFLSHYRAHLLDNTYVYPGVRECLAYFGKKKKIVLSNKRQEFVERILKHFGLEGHFVEVVGGDRFPYMKPDPRLVEPLLEKHGVKPEKAVMVGDGINDILLAKQAGIISCAFLYGLTRPEVLQALKPDYYCQSLEELRAFFR